MPMPPQCTLGDILSITEGTAYPPQQPMIRRLEAKADSDVPIAQGEQVLAVDVNIVWEIK